jgi:hypothetical protein
MGWVLYLEAKNFGLDEAQRLAIDFDKAFALLFEVLSICPKLLEPVDPHPCDRIKWSTFNSNNFDS